MITDLRRWTFPIFSALNMTAARDTLLIDGTVSRIGTGSTASIAGTEQTGNGMTVRVVVTSDGFSHTADVGSWSADEEGWTGTGDAMIDDRALSIRTTSGRAFTRIDTLISGAHKMVWTVRVGSATGLTARFLADLMTLTFVVASTQ